MKKALSIIASVFLVVALATTGVFADSLSSYFGSPSNCTVSFTDDGFTLSFSSANSGQINLDGTTSLHGVVEFTRTGSYQYEAILVNMTSGGSPTYEYSNLSSGLRVSGQNIYISASTMSGSFEFDTTTGGQTGTAAHAYFKTAANGASYAQNASVSYTFSELYVDGVPVVSSTVGEVFDFTLPAGYALVVSGECEILERNFSITNSWSFSNSDGNRVNGSSERLLALGNVVDGFSPDKNLSRSSLIQWQALNANIQGTASNYSFSANDLVSVPSGACFVISYPTLYGFGTAYPANATISYENSVDLTGNLYLQYSGERPSIRVVALESLSEYSSSGQFSTYSVFRPAVKDEVLISSGVSDDGHTILSPSSPLPSGGGNSGQPPVDEDSSLLGTISKFVNDIKNLLSSAVEAINTLISQGGQFMQNIGTMFTWLPAPLLTVIIGAFTVLLVVGVLKVLWR